MALEKGKRNGSWGHIQAATYANYQRTRAALERPASQDLGVNILIENSPSRAEPQKVNRGVCVRATTERRMHDSILCGPARASPVSRAASI